MQDENEMEEKRRLAAMSTKELENIARSSTVKMGEIYLADYGPVKVGNDELHLKSYVMAYCKIMGQQAQWNVTTLDIMMMVLSKLPLECGLDLLKSKAFTDFNAKLSAIRNKMAADRDRSIKALLPELFTPGADEKKGL